MDERHDLALLDGILLLIKELSVAVGPDAGEVDDHIAEELAFCVPEIFQRDGQWLIFPGAPRVWVRWNNQPADTPDMHLFADTFDDIGGLRERNGPGKEFDLYGGIDKYENYYLHSTEGQRVKSFQSFPLINIHDDTAKAFGVLNVHCDQPTFLGGSDNPTRRQEIFAGLVTPLVFDIASLAHRWFEIAKHKYLR